MDRPIGFLFSGQGAQTPGMGQGWMAHGGNARGVFEMAEALRPGTQEQCFLGAGETLNQTENTQPCLFCVDLAAAAALRDAGILPAATAGFSLGEIPAVAFAGMLEEKEAFSLVMERGRAMQACAVSEDGGMAAVLGLSNEIVERICEKHGVYPVNYNCPGQLVVAGKKKALDAALQTVKTEKGKAIPLKVSGAFHTPYMHEAQKALERFLEAHPMKTPTLPVYANLTAKPYEKPLEALLCKQVANPVRWEETLKNMWQDGIRVFIEVGVGKTLVGLVKKVLPEAMAFAVSSPDTLTETLSAMKGEGLC